MNTPPSRRIAYLTSEYPALSHTFILREVEALRARGIDVLTASVRRSAPGRHRGPAEDAAAATTFCVLDAARRPGTLLAAQVAALRHPGRYLATLGRALRLSPPGLAARLRQVVYFLEATVLARHLAAEGAGHIHNHFANPSATVAMLAADLARISFSFTLHGPADLEEPKRTRLDAKIARARFVACISHYARSQAMLHSDPADWPKLRIVHCGVEPELYAAAPDPAALPPDLVFVGRLAPVKGLRVLIEAMAEARAAVPDLTLTVIGDGPDRAWLEAAVRPFDGAVRIAGPLSQAEVAAALARARAMVLPSFAEGVPVVLMEAMASGRPVIATRITGVPELVEDGVSGLLVPPGDAASLAAAIVRLAREPETCRRMGAAGQARVRAEFDIAAEAGRMAALLEGRDGGEIRPAPDTRP
jgi:glycosyltransferase involved in cell wall biosynthesis